MLGNSYVSDKFLFLKCKSKHETKDTKHEISYFYISINPIQHNFLLQSRMCSVHLTNLPTNQLLFKGKDGVENGGDSKDISVVKCKIQKAM